MAIEGAYDRVLRILVLSIGIGSAIFTLLGLAAMIEQHPTLDPVFSYPAYVLFCALPPALAVVALRVPVPLLRVLAGVHALSGVVILLFWYPLSTPGSVPTESVPWIMNTIAVASCTGAIALPALWSWIYLAAVSVGSGFLRFQLLGSDDLLTPFQDALMIALFGVVMVTLVQLTLRSGRAQDAASLEAQFEAAATGAAETAERQRARYQEFTRNDVIATLHDASINGPDAAATGARAALALAKMDEFRNDYPTPSVLDPEEFEALLRTEELADVPIGFTVASQRDGRILIPADVADALAEAFAEAVRNSVRHAGAASDRPVLRRARVNVSAGGVEIEVSDDGRGFAVSRMPLDRFGVRVGILQRVNALDGGTATVESSARGGTTVRLAWQKGATAR